MSTLNKLLDRIPLLRQIRGLRGALALVDERRALEASKRAESEADKGTSGNEDSERASDKAARCGLAA